MKPGARNSKYKVTIMLYIFGLLLCVPGSIPAAVTVAPYADFDGDGYGDLAVAGKVDAATTEWGIAFSHGGLLNDWTDWCVPAFGQEGDKYFAGDFDANGLTDIAVCRRISSTQYQWGARYSIAGYLDDDTGFTVSDFGNDDDFFFVGDYNGDGYDDIAVCRPESATIYKWGVAWSGPSGIVETFSGWLIADFGTDGDRFYVGDFDGDGCADIARWRMVDQYTLKWSIRFSAAGFLATSSGWFLSDFGNAYDEFHVGDFDGNGKSDMAIARQVSGDDMVWGVLFSNSSYMDDWSGWTTRTEVGNKYFVIDYNGDGLSDMALNRFDSHYTTEWGVYTTGSRFLDSWSGFTVAALGAQEDRFYPGSELGNTIEAIAVREIGVTGSNSPDLVDYFTYGFYTEGSADWWCSEFVSWCYHRAGNPYDTDDCVGSFNFLDPVNAPWLLKNTSQMENWFTNAAVWRTNGPDIPFTPKPGDYAKTNSGNHSRMVQRVVGNDLHTIEGNSGNTVHKYIMSDFRNDATIVGFGRLYDNDIEDWRIQASTTGNYLRSVDFPMDHTGYAAGHSGTILKTVDGGITWEALSSGTSRSLYGIAFKGTGTGYAVGSYGTILKTTNGGSTWTPQSSGTTRALYAVSFYTTSKGVAVGSGGTILYTTNGGAPWNHAKSGTTNNLRDVDWLSSTKVVAVGYNGTVLKSYSGGQGWVARSSGTTRHLLGVDFVGQTEGWAVGSGGTIIHSTSYGNSWSAETSGTSATLFALDFHNSSDGHAAGSFGTILSTTNGGNTWVGQESGESNCIAALDGFGSTGLVWAAGSQGLILHCTENGGSM